MSYSLRVVLILLVASLLAGVVTGSTFYYRLAYLWGFIIASSWLMARTALRGILLKRSARSLRSQVGHIFEERFEILNTSRIPRLWLEVRNESSLPGARGSQVISMLAGRESRSYIVRTRLIERGVFPLGPTVIAGGDLFGLFAVQQVLPAQDSLLVYPMMVEIPVFPSPVGWLSGGEALRRRTQQITANAAGVRDYAAGDPLNRIHWLSTARRDRLIVKEFELDPMAEVWIFADASRYVQARLPYEPPVLDEREIWRPSVKIPLPPSTEEYLVSISASLARYYLQRGRMVGFVSAGKPFILLPAERGGRQLGKILEGLSLLRAEGKLPLLGLVEAQARNLPRGSTVVLVTPSVGNEVPLAVELLTRRGMHPVVVLIDAASFGGPSGSHNLVEQLQLQRVSVCRVSQGDELSLALASAVLP